MTTPNEIKVSNSGGDRKRSGAAARTFLAPKMFGSKSSEISFFRMFLPNVWKIRYVSPKTKRARAKPKRMSMTHSFIFLNTHCSLQRINRASGLEFIFEMNDDSLDCLDLNCGEACDLATGLEFAGGTRIPLFTSSSDHCNSSSFMVPKPGTRLPGFNGGGVQNWIDFVEAVVKTARKEECGKIVLELKTSCDGPAAQVWRSELDGLMKDYLDQWGNMNKLSEDAKELRENIKFAGSAEEKKTMTEAWKNLYEQANAGKPDLMKFVGIVRGVMVTRFEVEENCRQEQLMKYLTTSKRKSGTSTEAFFRSWGELDAIISRILFCAKPSDSLRLRSAMSVIETRITCRSPDGSRLKRTSQGNSLPDESLCIHSNVGCSPLSAFST